MKHQHFRQPALTTAIIFALLAVNTNQAQATNYTFSDLGTIAVSGTAPIYANGLNNLGHIVAYLGTAPGFSNGEVYGTVWNGSSWNTLPVVPGSTDHELMAINDHDQVTGWVGFAPAQDLYLNYRYDNGVPVEMGRISSTAWFHGGEAINNNGQIAGRAFEEGWEAVRWEANGTAVHLPDFGGTNGYPGSINDAGEMVGAAANASDDYDVGAYWDAAGNLFALKTFDGTPGAGWGADINNLGQIVGTSSNGSGRAAFWASKDATPVELTTLTGFHDFAANDINDLGQIVGWGINDDPNGSTHIFMWDKGTITDLSLLVPAELAAEGWRLGGYMPNINNAGQVAGYLINADGTRLGTYLLTPTSVPVPGAVWLFGSALAGFMGLRRKA